MLQKQSHIILTTCLAVLLLGGFNTLQGQNQQNSVMIPDGSFHSVLPEVVGEPNKVESFHLDETAVTNGEFLEFLKENPAWRKSTIPSLYSGRDYLRHWESDLSFGGETLKDQPVTRISWYAANAYCGWNGGRLPTINEWEYAAQDMEYGSSEDADQFSRDLIGWYSAVDANRVQSVGSTGIENRHGVKDLFGLVMEWVDDFKPPVGTDISLDCGTIGRMGGDSSIYSYAMSIRYLTRMSFSATSTTGMMGFRCAYDEPKNVQTARRNK